MIDVRLPGDFVGLRSVLLRTADHSAAAVTDAVVAEVPARRMLETFRALPRLGAAIRGPPRATRRWWSSTWSASAGATP